MVANSLKDLVVRTETNGLVTDLVNLDHVRSMLKTISYRKRFQAMQQQAEAAAASDHGTITSPLLPHVSLLISHHTRRSRNHRRRGRAVYTTPATHEQPRHRLGQTALGRIQLGRARDANEERQLPVVVGFVPQ